MITTGLIVRLKANPGKSEELARRWSCVGGELRAVRPCSPIGCGGRWKGGVAQAASGELSRWSTSGGPVMTMRSWSSSGRRRTCQSRV